MYTPAQVIAAIESLQHSGMTEQEFNTLLDVASLNTGTARKADTFEGVLKYYRARTRIHGKRVVEFARLVINLALIRMAAPAPLAVAPAPNMAGLTTALEELATCEAQDAFSSYHDAITNPTRDEHGLIMDHNGDPILGGNLESDLMYIITLAQKALSELRAIS